MKTLVLSCALLGTILTTHQLNAQCTVSQQAVSNIRRAGCTYTFDLNFHLKRNGGNKVTAVYIFSNESYQALAAGFYGSNNQVPTSDALNSANVSAVIKINPDSVLTVFNYQKKGSGHESPKNIRPNLPYTLDENGQVTIKDISLTFADCNSLITLKADVLSSQSPDLSSVGCITRELSFSPNEPIMNVLSKGCGTARTMGTSFITTQPRTIDFRAFRDVAPFGQFTGADTAEANAVSPLYSVTTAGNSANDFRAAGDYAYTRPNSDAAAIWVVAYTAGIPNISVALAYANACATLPTTFKSFSAQRNQQDVLVKWETATEENNRGFYVQRQTGSSDWQPLLFIPSQAPNGSSSSPLSYSYTDLTWLKGNAQYRIQQIDQDGKISYSEIRSVKSDEMAERVTVYPNPSADGKVTIRFDGSASVRNVMVSDVTGRVVKQFTNSKANSITLENLVPGLYTIQISNQTTAITRIEKVIVQNR